MKRRNLLGCVGVLALLGLASVAWASIRLEIPRDLKPPIYTSAAGPFLNADGSIFVIHDGEWAAIPFQRPLSSVPADFNLFDWFDPDLLGDPSNPLAGNPNVPLLIEGHAIWEGTEPIGVPAITEARGRDAIPVVFVKLAELEAASADGELTLPEVLSLDSAIIGTADFYHEQNHSVNVHQVSHLAVVAFGTLEDGRAFYLNAVEVAFELVQVQIVFE